MFKQLGLPGWKANRPCWYCSQLRENLPESDGDMLTSAQFFTWMREESRPISPILTVPGGGTHLIQVDWMHLVELGIGADLCGNVLWQALRRKGILTQGNIAGRLAALNGRLREYNARQKPVNPIGRLTVGMVKAKGEPPKLKAKAAECRHLQPWCLELAKEILQARPGQASIHMVAAADALIACSKAADERPFDLPKFQRLGMEFLRHYKWLGLHVHADGDTLWRFKPKHHIMGHLLYQVAPWHGAPSLYWCWLDESLGGQLAKAAVRRGGKASASRTSWDIMQKVAALGWVA